MPFWDQISPSVREIILRVIIAAIALVIIWVLRSVLSRLIVAPLRRRLESGGQTPSAITAFIDMVEEPVRFLIIAAGLYLGAIILGVNDVFLDHLARTLVIIGLALGLYRFVGVLALSRRQLKALTGINIEDELLPFIRTSLRLFVLVVAFVIIVQEWGYDVSGLVAGLGLGGLAISLAAQDTLSNLFGFTAVVGDRPFVEGETIKTPDVEGKVEQVGLRSTRIRQVDQSLVVVPNSKLAGSAILNWSRLTKRRYFNKLRIGYDIKHLQLRILLTRIRQLLHNRDHVEKESIQVFFIGFGENALEIEVSCMLRLPDWVQFSAEREEINLRIMEIMDEMRVDFALPGQNITIEDFPRFEVQRDDENDTSMSIIPQDEDDEETRPDQAPPTDY